ncbi:sigma factor [Arthrobacter alpinus]|nr:sigma factor [Arthrobacter alpinus]
MVKSIIGDRLREDQDARIRDDRELFCGHRAIHGVTTDSDIIRGSGENPQVFTALYDKYARMIYRYAARRAGESAAEDVMAETFLIAFERRDSFDHAWADARPGCSALPRICCASIIGPRRKYSRCLPSRRAVTPTPTAPSGLLSSWMLRQLLGVGGGVAETFRGGQGMHPALCLGGAEL